MQPKRQRQSQGVSTQRADRPSALRGRGQPRPLWPVPWHILPLGFMPKLVTLVTGKWKPLCSVQSRDFKCLFSVYGTRDGDAHAVPVEHQSPQSRA